MAWSGSRTHRLAPVARRPARVRGTRRTRWGDVVRRPGRPRRRVRCAARRRPATGVDRGREHRGRRGGLSRCSRRSTSGADGRTGEPCFPHRRLRPGRGGGTRRGDRAQAGHGPRAPSRPRVAALHLGDDGFAQAGAALPRQPRRQRDRDRLLPRPQAGRRRRNDPSAALLLRVVCREQPPGRGCCAAADRRLGPGPRVLAGVPGPPGHLVRRGAPHVRAVGPHRFRRPAPPIAALHHAGRWTARARRRTPPRGARPAPRLRLLRDVRPDRGHRPDGLPTTRSRPRGALRDRHPDPRRLVHAGRRIRSTRSTRSGRAGGRADLQRTQRDDGLRRIAPRLGAGAHRRPPAHGGRGAPAIRRALRDRRTPEPGCQGVRAPHRPRPRGAGAGRARCDRGGRGRRRQARPRRVLRSATGRSRRGRLAGA